MSWYGVPALPMFMQENDIENRKQFDMPHMLMIIQAGNQKCLPPTPVLSSGVKPSCATKLGTKPCHVLSWHNADQIYDHISLKHIMILFNIS
jgi:hypothetical protein